MTPDNWDPPDHERTYYRHTMTGDLGWLVRRDGKDYIKYDRPSHIMERPFRDQDWIAEREHRPLTRLQLAQVAFEADKRLCFFLGLHDQSRREWLSLKDEQRIAWSSAGPPNKGGRQELYQAVMAALARYAGK